MHSVIATVKLMQKYLYLLPLLTFSVTALADPNVVYGEDNRQDLYRISHSKVIKNAQSTLVFTIKGLIQPTASGDFTLTHNPLQRALNLCPEVRFGNQPSNGVCSSTLVSSRHVLTAGHCIPDQKRCDEIYLVSGFHVEREDEFPNIIPAQNVYRCQKLLTRRQNGTQDFALIELDREVLDRTPATLEIKSFPRRGDKVTLIGYPDGLPSKIVQGAKVRSSNSKMFVSNVDAFRGNSGSGIFSDETGKLVGILFKGDRDYFFNSKRGCYELNSHSEFGGRGEDATSIYGIWGAIENYLSFKDPATVY